MIGDLSEPLTGAPPAREGLPDFTPAQRKLLIGTGICFVFMIVEIIGGAMAHSLAIMTDAAHMLSDVAGFCVSLMALFLAKRKADGKFTYGYGRAEVVGAFISILVIWMMTGVLVYEAICRLIVPEVVDGRTMFIVSVIGLLMNGVLMFVLGHHHDHGHGGHGHGHGHGHAHGPPPKRTAGGHGHGHVHGHGGGGVGGGDDHGHADDAHEDCCEHGHEHGHDHGHAEHAHAEHAHVDRHHSEGWPTILRAHAHEEKPDEGHGHGHGGHGDRAHGHGHGGHGDHDDVEAAASHGSRGNSGGKGSSGAGGMVLHAAMLHVIGDVLQSVGVLVAAAAIWAFSDRWPDSNGISYWYRFDPVCTLGFSVLVLSTTVGTIKQATRTLMAGTPEDIDPDGLRRQFMQIPSVVDVHCLHVWAITPDKRLMTAHLSVDAGAGADAGAVDVGEKYMNVLRQAQEVAEKNDVGHTCFQLEDPHTYDKECEECF